MRSQIMWFALPAHPMFGKNPSQDEEIAEARVSDERPSVFNRWSHAPDGVSIGSKLLMSGAIKS